MAEIERTNTHPQTPPPLEKPQGLVAPALVSTQEDDQAWKADGWRFWLTLGSTCLMTFVSSLGSTIATALPTISEDLGAGSNYIWIAGSFLFAQTVIQPPCAQLCNIFGRRNPMICAIIFFAVGSAIAGSSKSSAVLIFGRTIQGLASGCISMLSELVICDLVPLRERGKYVGFVMASIALGTVVGPIISGALAQENWRWIFYLNIPVAGVALGITVLFLRLGHTKEPTWSKALARIDWIGNLLFLISTSSILIGVVSGGNRWEWSNWRVILSISFGACGWLAFLLFERSGFCKEPVVPPQLLGNATSAAGYYMTLLSSAALQWTGFFWPVYFQVRGASTLSSGVDLLPFVLCLMPTAAISGIILSKLGHYRPLHAIGFALTVLGLSLNVLLTVKTKMAVWVILQLVNGAGQGILVSTVLPAILTPLPQSDVATATGLYSFLRSFGFIWGITLPAIIFNLRFDKVASKIDDVALRDRLSGGHAYQSISGAFIQSLPQKVQNQVLGVYFTALKAVWIGAAVTAAAGALGIIVEKHVALRKSLETEFGLKSKKEG